MELLFCLCVTLNSIKRENLTMKKIIIIGLLFQFGSAISGVIKTNNPLPKRVVKMAFTEHNYKKFAKIQEMMINGDYTQARNSLDILSKKNLNKVEEAYRNTFLGYLSAEEKDFLSAANYYNIALDSKSLPFPTQSKFMELKAEMLISAGDYKQGIDSLHQYYEYTDSIKDSTIALEASAQTELKEYKEAIKLYKQAIELSEQPQEGWNYSLYSLHVALSQDAEALKVLETLRKINPESEKYKLNMQL
jgi:tetratricopeptide (TPR) repeat protein